MMLHPVAALPEPELQALRARVSRHSALRLALEDGLSMVESVPMDEFTRDVIFRLGDDRWLVYDTT